MKKAFLKVLCLSIVLVSLFQVDGACKDLDINQTSIEQKDISNEDKLFEAVNDGNLEGVKELIENGADVNAKNNFGTTPLRWVTVHNNIEVARLLIENGADVNVTNNFENTPLHLATINRNIEVARLLIEDGAHVDVKNYNGDTPLDIAYRYSDDDLLAVFGKKDKVYSEDIINKNISLGEVENITQKDKEIEFIDGIYGVYPFEYGSAINVSRGEDDNHIHIEIYAYRTGDWYISDIEIRRNENGKITGTKTLSLEELYIIEGYPCEDLGKIKVDIIYKDDELELKFNRDTRLGGRILRAEKAISVTEQGKQTAINNILDSDFKDINQDVFEVIHDTKNYLVVIVKCNVGYYQENYSEVGRYKYYNIDKKNKKILELDDIILCEDELNKYIQEAIEKKRDEWMQKESYWPWDKFWGIEQNYFLIDDENKMVKIDCLSYPGEAARCYGDLWIDVPFSLFDFGF